MNSKLIRYALTMCLMVATFATYSMVALAADAKSAGEILITGNDNASTVTVNGEVAKSGRSIFSSSTISTTDDAGAIVDLGKAGKLQLAHNTTFTVSFDDSSINGNLSAGSVTVLSAAHAVGVKTLAGDVKLNAGETAAANATTGQTAPTAATASGGDWGWWALIVGGAVAVIIITAAAQGDNKLGGSATQISPIR
jgi:hypothetical protein